MKRFFDSISHAVLKELIRKRVCDEKALKVIELIIDSFKTGERPFGNVGVPLGNVTSQLFGNIYLHELDMFVKHGLRERYYLRYCDDFIFLSNDVEPLEHLTVCIRDFLRERLYLELHPKKVILRKLGQGVDFIGYVFFQKHRLLRTRTKHRMQRRLKTAQKRYFQNAISGNSMNQRLQSYLGILSHANHYNLSSTLQNAFGAKNANL